MARDVDPPPRPTLADLTRAMPADRTLQNLLGVLSGKLELLTQLPVYEFQAASEGFDHCAAALRDVAEAERRSFAQLLECLRIHLDETPEDTDVKGRRG